MCKQVGAEQVTYTVFTWLNATAFITVVSKLVQLLFEIDHHLMLKNNLVILKLGALLFMV